MKKFLLILVSFLFVFIVGGVAGADLLTDTTVFDDTTAISLDGSDDLVSYGGSQVNLLEGAWDYVRWTHQFDPPDDINSASLILSLYDDGRDCFDVALSWAESGDWWLGEVDEGEYEYGVSTSFLNNGEFTVTLVSLGGDFFVKQSELSIDFGPTSSIGPRNDVSPVPEPATMMLFGVGLVGMALAGRKKFLTHG